MLRSSPSSSAAAAARQKRRRNKKEKKRLRELVHFTGFFLVLLLGAVAVLAWLLPSPSSSAGDKSIPADAAAHAGGVTGPGHHHPAAAGGGGGGTADQHRDRMDLSTDQRIVNNRKTDKNNNSKKKKKKKDRRPLFSRLTSSMIRERFAIRGRRSNRDRIAVVLPFVGGSRESVPSYLNLFCAGAAGAADVADFLIIHNGVLDNPPNDGGDDGAEDESSTGLDCPANVRLISLGSTEVFAEHLLRVVDRKTNNNNSININKDNRRANEDSAANELAVSRKRLVALVSKHIEACPYCLVEFKPALGHIFADYLVGYSHWGYADIDMLFGDLGRWITPQELGDFDIVTYGFGDQQRLYLRGQFTFHKNTEHINQIWRSCKYLADLDSRLVSVVQGDKKYHFESAEGCYSRAVLKQTDIKVKYAVKAWTDVHEEDTAYTNGIYVARNHKKDKVVVYKAESADFGRELLDTPSPWFETDKVYKDRKKLLQEPVGEMQEIDLPKDPEAKCMYWVQQKYQPSLCLPDDAVASTETVFWIDGKLYKQAHKNIPLETRVLTGPFFHFQEWKRYFRPSQLAPLHHSSPTSLFVLVKEGAIPLPIPNERRPYSRALLPSPLQIPTKHWEPAGDQSRRLLPSRSYCLVSGPRKYPPQPPAPACYRSVSWRDDDAMVEILSGAPGWTSNVRIDLDVTLVMTLQLTEDQAENEQWLSDILNVLVENLTRWQGQPSVVVIHVAGASEEAMALLRRRFGPNSDLSVGLHYSLIAVVASEKDDTVSRKALLNMAMDAVPTRWYISGIELERGLVISADAVYFANRALLTYDSNSWDVFLIPQFALDDEDEADEEFGLGVSLSDLETANDGGKVRAPSELEEACDQDVVARLDNAEALWWAQVKAMLDSDKGNPAKTAERIESMELSMLEYLTDEHHIKLFALDESPILMTDNVGPNAGMRTDEVVREVEELGGRRCYNGLRLAQMAALGYRFNVLAGAFAISTASTRKAPKQGVDESQPGSTRCDGCFMFGDEHEDILENIIVDEIRRPGKTAVLWSELYDRERTKQKR